MKMHNMGDNSQDILKQFFDIELQYFYNHNADYNSNRKIEITIAESIYKTALHLSIPDILKDTLMTYGKDLIDNLNGTVVLLKDLKEEGVQVILSKHAFMYNDNGQTLAGTISHELTHAHDFLDFADYLGTTNSELVMQNDIWYTLQMWSEFHARRNGFLRVLDVITGGTLDYPDDYLERELELIRSRWKSQRDADELYELMQLCGRYYVLEDLYSDKVNGFCEDMIKDEYHGLKLYVCNEIYEFCKTHTDFEKFIKDKDLLKTLIS